MVIYNLLYLGVLCELEDKDGLWCLMTHCSSCFREFCGFPSIRPNENKNIMKIVRCNTPNCANNPIYRQKLKKTNQYVGKS